MKTLWDQRDNNFDFLRLGLAVLVIFSHSYPLGAGEESLEPVYRWTRGQITGGAIAVDLFFVMSGFLITASAQRSKGLASFFSKRIARIYPGFVVAMLFGITLFAWIGDAKLLRWPWPRVGDFLLQTLRLREFLYLDAFHHNPFAGAINGSTWSIQYEFWCYVGVGLLLVCGILGRRVWLAALFVFSVCLSLAFLIMQWKLGGKFLNVLLGSPQLWARLLPYYLAGMVFYLFREKIRHSDVLAVVALIALAAASWVPFGWAAVFPVAGSYLIFYLAFAPWLHLNRFGRFGDFSYGTYLYAYPIQQTLMMHFARPVAPWLLFICATPITLLVAAGSWYGVERRFLRPARRKETIVHALEIAP